MALEKAIKKKAITEIVLQFLFLAAVMGGIWFVLTYLLVRANVMSSSMEPTLMTGDAIYGNRLAYKDKAPERGDIILFVGEGGTLLVKRVIGIEGDNLTFRDGFVLINGLVADESAYIPSTVETYSAKEFIVPEGCVFVMGDNRENSLDSRYFETPYISTDLIVGKYIGTSIISRLSNR